MNRRRFLNVLPLLPVVAVTATVADAATVEPIDTRPTFKLSDYVLWKLDESYICDAHGIDHGVYTHGCQPVAFVENQMGVPGSPLPATPDAVPVDLTAGCNGGKWNRDPHQHHNFRWIA